MADCGPGIVTRGVMRRGLKGMSAGSTVIKNDWVPRSGMRNAGCPSINSFSRPAMSLFDGSSVTIASSTEPMRCALPSVALMPS